MVTLMNTSDKFNLTKALAQLQEVEKRLSMRQEKEIDGSALLRAEVSGKHCNFCHKQGHTEQTCWKKKKEKEPVGVRANYMFCWV